MRFSTAAVAPTQIDQALTTEPVEDQMLLGHGIFICELLIAREKLS